MVGLGLFRRISSNSGINILNGQGQFPSMIENLFELSKLSPHLDKSTCLS
jgi:hypothetical protein